MQTHRDTAARPGDDAERKAQLAVAIAQIEAGLAGLDALGLSIAAAHVSLGLELARSGASVSARIELAREQQRF